MGGRYKAGSLRRGGVLTKARFCDKSFVESECPGNWMSCVEDLS